MYIYIHICIHRAYTGKNTVIRDNICKLPLAARWKIDKPVRNISSARQELRACFSRYFFLLPKFAYKWLWNGSLDQSVTAGLICDRTLWKTGHPMCLHVVDLFIPFRLIHTLHSCACAEKRSCETRNPVGLCHPILPYTHSACTQVYVWKRDPVRQDIGGSCHSIPPHTHCTFHVLVSMCGKETFMCMCGKEIL